MKATGIVRKIDDMGRLVIPIETRRMLDIKEGDPLEMYMEADAIVVKKFQPSCVFCGSDKRLVEHMGRNVCIDCRHDLQNKD